MVGNYAGDSWLANGGATLIAFWNGCVKLLALGYVFSYFGVSSTAVYYQLRATSTPARPTRFFWTPTKASRGLDFPSCRKTLPVRRRSQRMPDACGRWPSGGGGGVKN